jgi:ParB family chromosome partitioning protein
VLNVDADEARLIEIDENLMRRELSALDRAIFLAERKAAYDALHPETAKRGRRKKELGTTCPQFGMTFTKATAKRLGIDRKTIDRSLSLVAGIIPEARALLRLSDIADNQAQLLALANEEPEKQLAIATAIATGKASNPKAARLALGLDVLAEIDPQEKLFAQFLVLWSRANAPARAKIAGIVAEFVKPKKTKSGAET